MSVDSDLDTAALDATVATLRESAPASFSSRMAMMCRMSSPTRPSGHGPSPRRVRRQASGDLSPRNEPKGSCGAK